MTGIAGGEFLRALVGSNRISTRSLSAWKADGLEQDAHFSGSPIPLTIFVSAKTALR
ncbi:MAG: hypothetical protein R3F11_23260 [Verrucomicrobiales bacterium]